MPEPIRTFVYVVTGKGTVAVRNVTAGITEGDEASIEKGVEAGETVVIDVVDKLRLHKKVRNSGAQRTTV